jgi:TRAP-type mannitol/chloroaromatic compound transport system permease small subunit
VVTSAPAAPPNHRDASPAFRTTVEVIDRIASYVGRPVAWLIIPMTIAVTWEVVARHFFRAPTIWAYDVIYMLYGTHFMLGTAYTLMRIGHVRTDMLYSRWSIARQNTVDAVGYFFFFFPAMIFLFYFGWVEAYHALQIGETSDASPWRPIVWPFKFVIPLTALLLLIQGVGELLKSVYAIRTGREWVHREHLEIG